jgi:hypothetical protein
VPEARTNKHPIPSLESSALNQEIGGFMQSKQRELFGMAGVPQECFKNFSSASSDALHVEASPKHMTLIQEDDEDSPAPSQIHAPS